MLDWGSRLEAKRAIYGLRLVMVTLDSARLDTKSAGYGFGPAR